MTNLDFAAFKQEANRRGVTFPDTVTRLAMDADVQPSFAPNGGIPEIVATYIDPNRVKQLFAANMATTILGGEEKKGAWAQDTILIPRTEGSGDIVAYDDYSQQGANQVNMQWVNRQVFRYQTMVTYGELEQERFGLAMVPYAAEKQRQAIHTLNQASNKFYFYGVDNLENYGILNDPSLSAAISPLTVNSAVLWSAKAVVDKYNDILALYEKLVSQSNGILGDGVNMSSNLVLAMSNTISVNLQSSNEIFATSLEDMLKKAFPNIRIVTAPQYSTDAGELIQLFVEEAEGQRTGYGAYSEKLRSHPLITDVSSYKQKYSATTYGTIWQMPFAVVQMLGV